MRLSSRSLVVIRAGAHLYDKRLSDSARFARIAPGLGAVLDAAGPEVSVVVELHKVWSKLTSNAFANADEYPALRARLPPNDPAAAPCGLLELVRATRREPLHTLAIASLIDPNNGAMGAMGIRFLHALLALVLPDAGRDIPSHEELRAAKVSAEKSYRYGSSSRPRPDLRVELGSLIVVIENKIDDIDRENQLATYAEAAREFHDEEPVFVYLTPEGVQPTGQDTAEWHLLSYRALALAWRAVLAVDEAEGRAWPDAARAYLSTIARSICGWPLEADATRAQRSRLVPYLRVATRERGS